MSHASDYITSRARDAALLCQEILPKMPHTLGQFDLYGMKVNYLKGDAAGKRRTSFVVEGVPFNGTPEFIAHVLRRYW